MKALLMRDLCALKESRALILLMFLAAGIVAIWGNENSAAFITTYVTVLTAVLVLNTLGYDEMDNGYAFLFTMPFSRKKYVQAKYIFAVLIGLIGWSVSVVLSLAVRGAVSVEDAKAWALVYGGLLVGMVLVQAVMIPVQLKFGGPKGRVAILVLLAVCFGAACALMKRFGGTQLINALTGLSTMQMCLLVPAAAIIFAAISYRCSLGIMERKEF